ncbi:MAG: hypothetical protein ABFD16_02475 [Thermoguttaceae bacterium]
MKRLPFGFALVVIAVCLPGRPCGADESDAAVDAVLAKWEAASQKCRSLDARLTVFRYTPFTGDRPKVAHGRFYYEAPHLGRYEIWKGDRAATNDWSNLSEAVIWNGKETLRIEGETRACRRWSTAQLEQLQAHWSDAGHGWSGWLATIFRQLESPAQFLPLVVDLRAAEVRERFQWTLQVQNAERVLLKAVPKRPTDQAVFAEIDVILDTKTYLTIAIRLTSLHGKDSTVYAFGPPKINERPSDRDRLLEPELSGLRVERMQ